MTVPAAPVAWRAIDPNHPGWFIYGDPAKAEAPEGAEPLYLHPAPAVPDDVPIAVGGLIAIVEGITGAMKHGTWRDKNGVRLKDTPEWVALHNALNAANRAALNSTGY